MIRATGRLMHLVLVSVTMVACQQDPVPAGDHTLTLLYLPECPNAAMMRMNANSALASLHGEHLQLVNVDLNTLPGNDRRLGWGSPTLLLGDSDLFDTEPVPGAGISCRQWDPVPSSSDIARKIKARETAP
ncbi:MAG: hypothetical protein P8K80_05725 [Phycisphaerales bacterium]|nr:hypothetical protein [Phycisphaerales bacterium]